MKCLSKIRATVWPAAWPGQESSNGGRVRSWLIAQTGQTGAAAVEFALVLPVLLLILLGILDFSLALYDKAIITNASREGARAGIVLRSPKLSETEIRAVVWRYTDAALVTLGNPGRPTVVVDPAAPANFPTPLRVTVTYTFRGIAVGTLFGALGAPWVLTATSVMVNE